MLLVIQWIVWRDIVWWMGGRMDILWSAQKEELCIGDEYMTLMAWTLSFLYGPDRVLGD